MNSIRGRDIKTNQLLCIIWHIALFTFWGSLPNTVRAEERGFPADRPIIIKGEFNYPPYEFINELGEPDGFNVEIVEAIMKELNFPYTLVLEPWKQVIDELQQGKIDLVTGMMYTNERAKEFKFGAIHNHMFLSVIFRKGSQPINDIRELKGKEIIVLEKDITQEILEQEGFSSELIPVKNLSEGLLMLSKSKYDYAVASLEMARTVIRRYGIDNLALNSLTDLPIKEYCFAGSNDSLLSMVNQAFYVIKENGTYDTIYNRWFIPIEKKYIPTFVYLTVIALMLALLIFIVFVRLLRKQVKASNKKLELTGQKLALALSADNMAVWGYDVYKDTLYNIHGTVFPDKGIKKSQSIELVHPDDREAFNTLFKKVIQGEEPKVSTFFRFEDSCTTGWLYIETKFAVIRSSNGKVKTVIGTHKDVTDAVLLQEREKKLQKEMRESVRKTELVIQATNMVLWEFDCLTRTFKCYNEPVNHYDETQLLTLEEYSVYFHPEDLGAASADVDRMLRGEEKCLPVDVRVKYPNDESWHFCTIQGTPLEYNPATGRIIKYAGFRRDNTEMLLAQRNLEEEKEKAQQADRLKSAFLANMSHEIRTPLNAVVGFSSLLHELEDEEEHAKAIELINTNSDLLLRLINDILDLSKIEAGVMSFSHEEFDMAAFFDGFAISLRQRITKPEVTFITENPYEECIIHFDRNRLAQVYTNFVGNAIKYISKGHIRVGYSCTNEGIRIYVEDTGIGISAGKHHLVFQRFEKLDDFAQGTGLGLSICKAITDAAQGEIGFTSEEGQGSTFWAWFPCRVQMKKRATE